jgi:endonuclease YncB( thermonuclease family)
LLLLVVVILALILLIIIRQQREQLGPRPTGRQVIDGDTFARRDGQLVRLLGIDTPEEGEPYYQQARQRLGELLDTHELGYRFGERRYDRYDRLLALVYADSRLVNLALLEEGLARTYFFPEDFADPIMLDSMCAAQQRARLADRGIWSLPTIDLCDRYFGNPGSRRFHRPSCSAIRRSDTTAMIRLLSRDEFLDSCYSPCRNCDP